MYGSEFHHSFTNRCLRPVVLYLILKVLLRDCTQKEGFSTLGLYLAIHTRNVKHLKCMDYLELKQFQVIFFEPKSLDGIKSMKGDFFDI